MTLMYYLCGLLLIISLLLIMLVALVYLISPKDQRTGKKIPRSRTIIGGITASLVVAFVFGGLMSVTEPSHIKTKSQQEKVKIAQLQKEAAEKERLRKIEESKPKTKTETKKETINFAVIEKQDGALPLGEKKISNTGINGERTITYAVMYANGKETARREIKNEITKAPADQVILIGTYVQPTAPNSGNGYTNSQGNYIPSPSSDPTGATAKCVDGTYSYSQSRRGTCSHHGGVAQWL